ncbi:MAG: winged helix-turn-helix domain-containing protein [Pseudomonadota bacterium]
MIYRFANHSINVEQMEMHHDGALVAIEPQVFSLLCLLIENRHRAVSRDEILDKIWDGRVVSDSALSSRIKSARQAVGDSGSEQRIIKTLHGRGFRFVADVSVVAGVRSQPEIQPDQTTPSPTQSEKPAIAVLPLTAASELQSSILTEALPQDFITSLSRLRWLTVIARGSSFRFQGPDVDIIQVGQILKVNYCVSGTLAQNGNSIELFVELADCSDGHVVWGERLIVEGNDIFEAREEILNKFTAAMELHIPRNEAEKARLGNAGSLSAWSEYHLGLQAMYRFNRSDNNVAASHFARSIEIDPDFSRAHAGLSFTSFQDAFLNYSDQRNESALAARRHAERAVELDSMDSFASFTLGRSYFLSEEPHNSFGWLDRSLLLSPSFAQAHYSRGWAASVFGDPEEGLIYSNNAMRLSPLDPLMYGMMGARAMAHMERGEYALAAQWGEKAATAPFSHVMLGIIALLTHALNGDDQRALYWADNVRRRRPDINREAFFKAFPFRDKKLKAILATQMQRLGF